MGTDLERMCLDLIGYPAPLSNTTDYIPGLADIFYVIKKLPCLVYDKTWFIVMFIGRFNYVFKIQHFNSFLICSMHAFYLFRCFIYV